MIKRLVDANRVKRKYKRLGLRLKLEGNLNGVKICNAMIDILDSEPTVKESIEYTAYWEICSDGHGPYCSACKSEPPGDKMTKFCPECGSRMEG